MRRAVKILWAPLLMAAVCLPPAQALQQQTPPPTTNPVPPAAPVPAAGSQQAGQGAQQPPASPVQGAAPTVTGGLAASVGESGDVHSQITGGLQFSELFDSNFQDLGGNFGWDELSTIGGHMEIHRTGASTDLMVRYVGGGYIDPKNSPFDSTYQQLEVAETLQFRRWSLKLDDLFSYLPESAFGFGGDGIAGGPSVGLTLLNPFEVPSQSIFTNLGKRVSNAALAEVQYNQSARSAWTFTGSYGLLHFTDSGDLDSTSLVFSTGYNYQLTERDTLGFSYQFSAYRFNPAIESINDNTVMVTYGRHLTDRLMFKAGIGPDFFGVTPLLGPSPGTQIGWSSNASLAYQLVQTTLTGSFSHGISAGSGILAGSTSTLGQFSASRQVGQWTTLTGAVGYSLNQTLPQVGTPNASYNGIYASVGFNRKLSRSFSVNASYNFTHQTTDAGVCTIVGCATEFTKHQIWVGFSWDMHPIPIN
jgi:hypothetical protein